MSRIVVQCRCGQRFAATPQHAGHVMPCPSCGAGIVVPATSAPEPSAPAPSAPAPSPPAAVENDWIARLPDGRLLGPGTLAYMRQLVVAGQLPPGVEVKRQNDTQWRPLDGGAPVAAPTPSPAPPRTPRKSSGLSLIAAGLVAAVVFGGIGYWAVTNFLSPGSVAQDPRVPTPSPKPAEPLPDNNSTVQPPSNKPTTAIMPAIPELEPSLPSPPVPTEPSPTPTTPAVAETNPTPVPPTPRPQPERPRNGPTPVELPHSPPPRRWQVEADPLPEFTGTLVAQPMPLGPEWTRDARFTSAAVAKMATLDQDEDKNFAVQRWDLKKKRKISTNLIATDSELVDYRPDGVVYATVELRGKGDVIVWSCGEKEDKEIARLRSSAKDEFSGNGPAEDGGIFIGQNLLLCCGNDKLTAYKLPSGDVAYELDGYRALPAFSCGRKYFLGRAANSDGVYTPAIITAADGKPAGILEPPHDARPLFAYFQSSPSEFKLKKAAFHPDGKHLAAYTEGEDLVIWNLEHGRIVKYFANVGSYGSHIRWGGVKHLVLGDRVIFDADRGYVVWNYSFSRAVKDSPDGKVWGFDSSRVAGRQTHFVFALFAPTAKVIAAIEQMHKDDPPLVQPGGAVKLDFSLENETPDLARLRARLLQATAAALEKRKVGTTDDTTDKLSILIRPQGGGPDFVFRDNGREWFVPQRHFEIIVRFTVRRPGVGGNYLRSTTFDLPKLNYKFNPDAADPADDLLLQYEGWLAKKLQSMLEDDLFNEKGGVHRPGSSRVDLEGEEFR